MLVAAATPTTPAADVNPLYYTRMADKPMTQYIGHKYLDSPQHSTVLDTVALPLMQTVWRLIDNNHTAS
jgi:hypothetical protein